MSRNKWNNYSGAPNLKRPYPHNTNKDDGDDDDISLVSRSPSPTDAMDVDSQSFSTYDEYIRGNPPEVITVETKIKNSNKGYELLQKQGWSEGQSLGLSGDGRVDPIPFLVKQDLTGLGKISQDVRMIETTVSQRRGLDSERQQRETEYQRKAREDTVARQQALKSELSTTLASFYCALCSKQFQNVAQFDEHTNSYAHHHKARMKDMPANAKGVGLIGADAKAAEERKEKERRREDKELRRAAKAAGVKMPKPVASASTTIATPVVAPPASEGNRGFKTPRWATMSSMAPAPPASSDTYQSPGDGQGGRASVGSSSDTRPTGSDTRLTGSSGGWASISSSGSAPPPPPPEHASYNMASAPTFRNAGWTSLDTGSSQAPPPPRSRPDPLSSSFAQAPPPPPPQTYAPIPPTPSSSYQPSRAPPSQSNQWGSMSQLRQPIQQPPSSYTNVNPSQNYYGSRNDNVRYPSGPPQPPSAPPAPSSSHHPPRGPPNQSNRWPPMSQPQQPIQQPPSSYSNANPSQSGNRNDNVRHPPGPPQPPSGPPLSRYPPPPGPSYNHPPL